MIEFVTAKVVGKAHKCPSCCAIECRVVGIEDASLAEGGSYDVHKCSSCDKTSYVMVPD